MRRRLTTPARPAEVPARPAEVPARPAEIPVRAAKVSTRPAEIPGRAAEVSARPAEIIVTEHQHTQAPANPRPSWREVLMLLLGAWLVAAPFLFAPAIPAVPMPGVGIAAGPVAARITALIVSAKWVSWAAGALAIILALVAGLRWRWTLLLLIILGVCLALAPWLLHLTGPTDLITPSGASPISGFALMVTVVPGTAVLIWSDWICGVLLALLAAWSVLRAVSGRSARRRRRAEPPDHSVTEHP